MTNVLNRAGEDRWFLDALPPGAIAEVDGFRYRKNESGQWIKMEEAD